MTTDDLIDKLSNYLKIIRFDDVISVEIIIKPTWGLIEHNTIKFAEGKGTHIVYSEDKTNTLKTILTYIFNSIEANINQEKKEEMLKQKIAELTQFANENTLTDIINIKIGNK